MTIWLINPYDELPGEGAEQRYGTLCRMLRERGHEVWWISSRFRHRTRTVYSDEECCVFKEQHGVFIVDAPGYQRNISLRRLWSQWQWGRNVIKNCMQLVEQGKLAPPDIVLASSPPLEGAAAAIRLAEQFGAKSIVDLMDDWPETWLTALRAGRWKIGNRRWGKCLLWPWFWLARKNLRKADAVCAQSQRFAQKAAMSGREHVEVCYLGEKPAPVDQSVRRHEGFTILYLGAMGAVYEIDTLLETARMARDKNLNWQWVIAGTDPDGRWEKKAAAEGLSPWVSFPGYLDQTQLDAQLFKSDVGVIPMDPDSGVAVPYKAGTYLRAGLPVVNSLPGELADMLATTGAGKNYIFGSADDLLQVLEGYADDPEARHLASLKAAECFHAKFNKEKTYPAFLDWILKPK